MSSDKQKPGILSAADEQYMRLALKLAVKGYGAVEPNPAVGAVIVKNGKVIGQGYHKKFGGPHGEIEALKDCRAKGNDPKGATVYVTLEPCCHWGKTGPCTEALIKARVKRVVAAVKDPSSHCGGKGLMQLQDSGIMVQVGLLGKHARDINLAFFKFTETGRPWVILKWAQSLDGKLAYTGQELNQRWISGEQSRADVHNIRRQAQAIVAGIGTVLADDPLLTPRPDKGRKPLRVVLDPSLQLPIKSKLVQSAHEYPLLVYTSRAALRAKSNESQRLISAGAMVEPTAMKSGLCDIEAVVDDLAKRGAQRVLVEGGAKVLESFISAGLGDEILIYVAPKILGGSGGVEIVEILPQAAGNFEIDSVKSFDKDVRYRFLRLNQ